MPQIRTQKIEPDVTILAIAGRITLGRECQDAEWAVESAIQEGVRKLVLDLTELTYVDSTGIGILVTSYGKMRSAGGELRLAAPQPKIAELLRITRINEIITLYPTIPAAIEGF